MRNPFRREPKVEKQELWCHHCQHYVQFDLDMSLNGNHILNCPNCNHEHCRVVKNGKITSERWDSRNQPVIIITNSTFTLISTYDSSTSTDYFLYQSWMNTGATQ